MFFEIVDKSLLGRIGKIYTRNGYFETPALFPVIKVDFNPDLILYLKKLNCKTIITNAYLLWKKLNKEVVDIHQYFNFTNIIMTDSGGYQVLKYRDIEITPKESLLYQIKIKSDIGVILDYPTGLSEDIDFAKRSVTLTLRRASYAKRFLKESDMIIVAPIQGGMFYSLLTKCALKMKEMGYEMFAIGSPTGLMERYRYKEVLQMILTVKKVLGNSKPIHLFGAGHPMFFPFIVALGIDTFDSAAYSLYAKDNRYMTRTRTYRLDELSYLPCNCEVCRRIDAETFKNLNPNMRITLLEKHNLYVSLEEIKHIKLHIKEGTLWNYLEEKARAHPYLYEAFVFLKENIDIIEEYDPITKINVSGIFFFDPYSSLHPSVIGYHKRLLRNYVVGKGDVAIFIPFLKEKPFSRSHLMKNFKEKIIKQLNQELINKIRVIFVGYPFILIPYELSEIYPNSQWEGEVDSFPYRKYLHSFIKKIISKLELSKSILIISRKSQRLFYLIESNLKDNNVEVLKIIVEKNLSETIEKNRVLIEDFLKK
ncbi:MAG: tRNA guanosine(15) transglycosylase TgtA [Thermoproteota archaeon]|jgi:7-cyano-7-deazaguanine tRNA-ribosyltransferase|nr:tRNA guanosine(15) transglycosylase TgtA [Thermoproteota archaeon]